MLHSQLIDIINSGDAWAFIGSGPSTDAGMPSWKRLVEVAQDHPAAAALRSDQTYAGAFGSGNYPRCFGMLERTLGRDVLEQLVGNELNKVSTPGDAHRLLADLPFAGYITTNYDLLLEKALGSFPGWASVGNVGDESRKVSRDARDLVWHVHGALGMLSERSRLVLTQRDYDDFYLEDSSALRQLRGLLAQRHVVIIGFGFADAEVTRLLRSIGRWTDPARPIFAMLPKKGDFGSTSGRRIFLHENNIDVVPYKIRNGSHRALYDLLNVYSALSLGRGLAYGQPRRAVPSYDPETTGLLVYNELVLSRGSGISLNVRQDLLRSRVLAMLSQGATSPDSLSAEVSELAKALGRRVLGSRDPAGSAQEISEVLTDLENQGLVTQNDDGTRSLTENGHERVADHAAVAKLLEDQFRSSLQSRAEAVASDPATVSSLQQTVEGFLKDCIARRALGVAMAMTLRQPAQVEYHMVALLQSLRDRLIELDDEEQARILVQLVQDILRAPSAAERKYIGVTLQARFGLHLLGYDDATLASRLKDISETAFIIDSSTLIPLLARSTRGHTAALRLIQEFKRCGASVITTRLLVEEVAEHAQWALDRVQEGGGTFESLPVFEAATGRAGQRSNAFFGGYAVELAGGSAASTFRHYVVETCALPSSSHACRPSNVEKRLKSEDIETYSVRGLAGYSDAVRLRAEETQARLQRLRESAETFTRDRQVEAEAEALAIVEGVRNGSLGLRAAQKISNAYFISYTRIIDEVAQADIAITMRPEAALQWLSTLRPCSVEEMGAITSGLLWELQERGLDFVDKTALLRAFRPFIDASESQRQTEIERLRMLTGQNYAGEPSLEPVEPLDLPVVMESHYAQRARDLETQLAAERARVDEALRVAELTDRDRQELERLRSKEIGRRRFQRRTYRQKKD